MTFDIQANHRIMQRLIFRKTNGFAMQPFQMCAKIQIGSLNLPRLVFSDIMLCRRNIFRIALPIVRRIRPNRESSQFVDELFAHRIRTFAVLMG